MKKVWYRLKDGESEWRQVEVKPRSILAQVTLYQGQWHDDGFGNKYKYDLVEDDE